MADTLPKSYMIMAKPQPSLVGIRKPTPLIANDMDVFANKNVPEALVYKVVKALRDNKPMVFRIFKPLVLFQPSHTAAVIKDVSIRAR